MLASVFVAPSKSKYPASPREWAIAIAGPVVPGPADRSTPSHSGPGVHVNYAETVLPMRDGLPKFKDFPATFGGSGEQLAE